MGRGPKSGCKMVTLFGGYSYDGVSAGIWVIHTEVPNLGARWSRFFAVTLMMASAGIWVIHTEVPNLGARWSRFLAVTFMMAERWYMGHTYRGPKSGCKMVTLFGGYSYDGVSAAH